jgi:leishmanolysin
MKIHTNVKNLHWMKNADPAKYKFLVKKLIPAMTHHVSSTFNVRERQSLKVTIEECFDNQMSKYKDLKGELKVDLVLIFSAKEDMKESTIAAAASCQSHSYTSRPVIGEVMINPNFIKLGEQSFNEMFTTFMAQIYHIMGFTTINFNRYMDPATNIVRPRSDVIKNEPIVEDSNIDFENFVHTPKLMAFAEKFFDCPTLVGVPIEIRDGSRLAKWETMVLGNEIMSAQKMPNQVISRFTLKFFEDMGWYKVNYRMAEELKFSQAKGCRILHKHCRIPGKDICEDETKHGCYHDYTLKSTCVTENLADRCMVYTNNNAELTDCRY